MQKLVWLIPGLFACAVDGDRESSNEQAATSRHSTQRGGSLSVNLNREGGSGYLIAFENGSGSTRFAYLLYTTATADPASRTCQTYDYGWGEFESCSYTRWTYDYGSGEIPSTDLRVSPQGGKLATTIGPAFYAERCTQDYVAGTTECTSPYGQSVDLRWSADGVSSSFTSGVTETTYGAVTIRTQGQSRNGSALVSGSLLGFSVADAPALVGDSRGTSITHELIKN